MHKPPPICMKGYKMANNPSWVGKVPSDMTNDELAEAKRTLGDQLAPTQERLNTLAAAVGQLDWEINYRFRMAGAANQPNNALPPYPADAVNEEFGKSGE